MSEREELAARALADAYGDALCLPQHLTDASIVLHAADAPILTLIEEAENRRGSMYCKVTTYELRKALGLNE